MKAKHTALKRTLLTLGSLVLAPILLNNIMSRHMIKQPLYRPTPHTWSAEDLTITWLGHASFLINFFGKRILIDPVLSQRAGLTLPYNYNVGRKRLVTPPLTLPELGPIDILLLSHSHVDHFDYPTLRGLQTQYTSVVTPRNTAQLFDGMIYENIIELYWGRRINLQGVIIQAIQGNHRASRLPWQKYMTANSYLISYQGVNIFYAGDTSYTPLIREQLLGIPIDIAIFGIANYWPPYFQENHCTPEQAWSMAQEIGAKWIIPMHWGTFNLSQEPKNEPLVRFIQAAGPEANLIPLRQIGQTWGLSS